MTLKKFPIGIQEFEDIIKEGYVYIDKTSFLYKLVTEGKPYFLSRPRRFGKSLLTSTLAALFSAKRELFKGLWIDTSPWPWNYIPVIRMDMSAVNHFNAEVFELSLINYLKKIAAKNDINAEKIAGLTSADYLSNLIDHLALSHKVAVLIDEYDKPIIDHLDDLPLAKDNQETLKRFYNVLKTQDHNLQFILLTGVTKFSKVSLFSGLNNLKDISLYETYATMLGWTDDEIAANFSNELDEIALSCGETVASLKERLKRWYNGYRFGRSQTTGSVYNPLSIMQFLETGRFDNYWFGTATPTFAIKLIKEQQFPLVNFEAPLAIGRAIDESYEVEKIDLLTLLYQTGYLTIDKYDEEAQRYFLRFPNDEVRRSFLDHLFQEATQLSSSQAEPLRYEISVALLQKNFEIFFQKFNQLLASIPYHLHLPKEAYYHSLFYIILRSLSFDVASEVLTSLGRIDMVLVFQEDIFIFEFKIDSSASSALTQIKEQKYYEKYKTYKKIITLIGANFDSEVRTVSEWVMEVIDLSNC